MNRHVVAAIAMMGSSFATPLQARADELAPSVRLRVHAASGGPVKTVVKESEARFVRVCAVACTTTVPRGSTVRLTLDDDDDPRDIVLDGAESVDLEVRPESKGPLAGSIAMIAAGGITAVIGLVLFAVSTDTSSDDSESRRNAGLLTTVLGGGLAVAGVVVMSNRLTAPRVRQTAALLPTAGNPQGFRHPSGISNFPSFTTVFEWRISF